MADRFVSRGAVISLIAGVPLVVSSAANAALSPPAPAPATPAAALLTTAQLRANYKYVDVSPNPAQATCATCYAFRPSPTPGPNASATCLLVPGPIQPGGWCTVWGLNPSLKPK